MKHKWTVCRLGRFEILLNHETGMAQDVFASYMTFQETCAIDDILKPLGWHLSGSIDPDIYGDLIQEARSNSVTQ